MSSNEREQTQSQKKKSRSQRSPAARNKPAGGVGSQSEDLERSPASGPSTDDARQQSEATEAAEQWLTKQQRIRDGDLPSDPLDAIEEGWTRKEWERAHVRA